MKVSADALSNKSEEIVTVPSEEEFNSGRPVSEAQQEQGSLRFGIGSDAIIGNIGSARPQYFGFRFAYFAGFERIGSSLAFHPYINGKASFAFHREGNRSFDRDLGGFELGLGVSWLRSFSQLKNISLGMGMEAGFAAYLKQEPMLSLGTYAQLCQKQGVCWKLGVEQKISKAVFGYRKSPEAVNETKEIIGHHPIFITLGVRFNFP